MNTVARWLGQRLSRYLTQPGRSVSTSPPTDPAKLAACLRPGDVLLVEGNTRISTAIKYLTQSTWSHAALFVGALAGPRGPDGLPLCLVEADMVDGVHTVGLVHFRGLHCRVCRPVSLTPEEAQRVCAFALARVGLQYDLKNVWDLARYLLPLPPVPTRWRRRMLALGSGDPTRGSARPCWRNRSSRCATRFCRASKPCPPTTRPAPTACARSCMCATTACTCRATSTCRPTSRSSSPRSPPASTITG
ncbi:hypothetical protein LP416_13915 [Polaromonas sp. P2-4]|nr:hypothetical protein LP416_13915 [Polaromonas sp. P2-4]